MNDATRNAVHVIAMYAAYTGTLLFFAELYVDVLAPRLARWRKRRQDRRVLASIARLEPIEPEILQKLYARSLYGRRRVGVALGQRR